MRKNIAVALIVVVIFVTLIFINHWMFESTGSTATNNNLREVSDLSTTTKTENTEETGIEAQNVESKDDDSESQIVRSATGDPKAIVLETLIPDLTTYGLTLTHVVELDSLDSPDLRDYTDQSAFGGTVIGCQSWKAGCPEPNELNLKSLKLSVPSVPLVQGFYTSTSKTTLSTGLRIEISQFTSAASASNYYIKYTTRMQKLMNGFVIDSEGDISRHDGEGFELREIKICGESAQYASSSVQIRNSLVEGGGIFWSKQNYFFKIVWDDDSLREKSAIEIAEEIGCL